MHFSAYLAKFVNKYPEHTTVRAERTSLHPGGIFSSGTCTPLRTDGPLDPRRTRGMPSDVRSTATHRQADSSPREAPLRGRTPTPTPGPDGSFHCACAPCPCSSVGTSPLPSASLTSCPAISPESAKPRPPHSPTTQRRSRTADSLASSRFRSAGGARPWIVVFARSWIATFREPDIPHADRKPFVAGWRHTAQRRRHRRPTHESSTRRRAATAPNRAMTPPRITATCSPRSVSLIRFLPGTRYATH